MSYNDQFLNLNCSFDVLKTYKGSNGLGSLPKNFSKEISESLAVINEIKSAVLKHSKVVILDLCAGNALTSIISCFLFKNLKAIAIDLKPRKEDFSNVANFQYLVQDIYNFEYKPESGDYNIVIGVHPCKDLAFKICNIFKKIYKDSDTNCKLVLMPCCKGKIPNQYSVLQQNLNKYELWSYYLAKKLESELPTVKFNVKTDKKIISPCNILVTSLE